MKNGKEFLLTDTTGFIQKLPTTLVTTFRATLEEISESSLLVHVVDISHPLAEQQIDVVDKVLSELDVASIPKLMVWNKLSKSAQQQRLVAASQLVASTSLIYSAVAANKCMNLLLQQQQSDTQRGRAATALMMGEDMHKFRLSWLDRNEFPMNSGLEMVNPGSRQIYLTFPADSTFREEDVSNYSSVLVKPYKEKGKVPDKYSCSISSNKWRDESSQHVVALLA
ncbi:unnamed protein product [Camellia sinensis]